MKTKLMPDKKNIVYVSLIILIWLITYVVVQVLFEQKLGWDEVNYMSIARGIAQDGDFEARSYTIMGLIKYGYPTHIINYPLYSVFLAIFFKIFGVSMYVAYFANWLCGLGVCILMYFIILTLVKDSHKLAFIVSLSYLFTPGILKNCDTAMMEQCGCLLLCLFVYLIFKDYDKGAFNFWTILKISLSLLILFLYKSLYIGYFFGILCFIVAAYRTNITGKMINTKIPFFAFLASSFGLFVILFCIANKFIFLPVAPMMNFSPEQDLTQVYANFLGGYFNDFTGNVIKNLIYFFKMIILPYFIYPTNYLPYTGEILHLTSCFVFLGLYILMLFLVFLLSFSGWRYLSSIQRIFVLFSFSSIISFNLIFDVLFRSYHSNIWRYNYYYLPVYLCLVVIVFRANSEYVKSFKQLHPKILNALVSLLFIFIYSPLFISTIVQYVYNEDYYHIPAKRRAELIEQVLGGSRPRFIYFNDGIHTTYVTYPVIQIFKDATNDQLMQVNKILPEPIEYLFLRSSDWLLQNNKDLIIQGKPILNGMYKPLGYNEQEHVVIYQIDHSR